MKKMMLLMLAICLLLAGCGEARVDTKEQETGNAATDVAEKETAAAEEEAAPVNTVYPLPDTTMENLTDAILAVSFEEGDAYVDDTGKMQLNVKIYTYDVYDAVDISGLKVGDIIATHAGEVEVTSVKGSDGGNIYINGGLEEGGFDLASNDGGTLCEIGFNDAKNWYEIGEATIRVSADFEGRDNADPEQGEIIIYPGDFLTDGVENYNFTPYNTTIRVEAGQIVELERRYTP